MADAAFALQTAIQSALIAAPEVVALLGGARVYDDVPRGAALPYVSYGMTTLRDWSTGGDDAASGGAEHAVTLHVWSKAAGRHEAQAIMDALRTALHARSLALAQHRLVNLRHELSEVRRDPDVETFHGIVRLRAVTEPVS